MKEKEKDLPIMLSLTLSAQGGRTFSGQTLLAFLASIQHTHIVSVGLNCSFGAADMKPYLQELAKYAPIISALIRTPDCRIVLVPMTRRRIKWPNM